MILLYDFSPIKPDFGLMFWTFVLFLLFHFIMKRVAFGPMRDALLKRDTDISSAIEEAAKAKAEMANLKSENDKVLSGARQERAMKLKEAKEERARIISEAKEEAKVAAQTEVAQAMKVLDTQKVSAITELKKSTGGLAVTIASKLLNKDMSSSADKADALINELN